MASAIVFKVGRPSLSHENRSRSKAQMSLKKIIDFISSSPPPLNLKFESQGEALVAETHEVSCCREREFEIDLNLSLGSCLEVMESENQKTGPSSACSGVEVGAKSVSSPVISECYANTSLDFPAKEEIVEDQKSEITKLAEVQDERRKTEKEVLKEGKENKSDGYLGLLVEAARLVCGGFKDDKEEQEMEESSSKRKTQTRKERNESIGRSERWMVDFYQDIEEDISPVVRSKRGRNQTLPSRYRDSVLEPLSKTSSFRVCTKTRKK